MPYKRKTVDEWEIQGFHSGTWELETTETTWKLARENAKAYRQNCPGTSFRIIKRRVKIDSLTDEQLAEHAPQLLKKDEFTYRLSDRQAKKADETMDRKNAGTPALLRMPDPSTAHLAQCELYDNHMTLVGTITPAQAFKL